MITWLQQTGGLVYLLTIFAVTVFVFEGAAYWLIRLFWGVGE